MRLLHYSGMGNSQTAVYEISGIQVAIPADTHNEDIDLAIVESLGLSDNAAAARAILEHDDIAEFIDILVDEIIPYLELPGNPNFNRSTRLNQLMAKRGVIRARFPNGQPVPRPRKKPRNGQT